MSIRLRLIGSPQIEYGGASHVLPSERRNQLLVFLACRRTWVGRTELAALLWPEQPSKLAYSNLRKTLFRLQSAPWARCVELQGNAIRVAIESDTLGFETALREGRVADALALHGGEQLLAGFDDDANEIWSNWLAFERERLRGAWRNAALEHLAGEIAPAAGIELSARLLAADPLDEAALHAQMTWLARNGQAAHARQVYREFADRLAAELALAPGAELQALHGALCSTAAAPAPLVAETPGPADGGFVGRVVELRRIAELLAQDGCRLLCLIGPGGVGKTRLAQRAIAELAHGHADGAVFVPLEDVATTRELGARLARELDLALAGSGEPLDQVIGVLRERQMLVVFDNFEHLAADAAVLDRLLQQCARLKILVTSRVRLAVASEWLLPLEGLPCPGIEDQEHVEAFDAARLFVQAARRVEPGLVASAEAVSIVDICRQVEGLPLALELAAAWTRVLPCREIAAELRHGIELLRAADAAQPERHASIEVVFEQSWRMLSSIEREALARLSIFRGGFSVEAARTIVAASLPVLGALCDKSLLRKEGARLFMHSLVQQLVAARLRDDARDAAERLHAQYFHRLLAQLRRPVEDGDREALHSVETEFENCRRAWHWSIAHGATEALQTSAPTLLHFCDHLGRLEEGMALLRHALDAQAGGAQRILGLRLLSMIAHLEYRLDRYAQAEATATRALAATEVTRDHDARLQSLKVLGGCCLRLGKHADAQRYFTQALQLAPASVDPHNAAAMYDNLALVEKAMGRYAEAQRLCLQSLLQHQRLGDVAGEALCLNNLAALHLAKREYESAGVHLKAGLAVCDRHGLVSTRGLILANLTEVALKSGDLEAAEHHARRALEIAQAGGNRAVVAWLKLQFARLALSRGDFAAARGALAESLETALVVGRPILQLLGVVCFADLLVARGEAACANLVLAFAAEHPSMNAPERDELRARLARSRTDGAAAPKWPGIELAELVHRIVAEAGIAHAQLLAALRSAHQPAP